MWNNFEPNVNATIAFLKLLKVKVNRATVNESLQNHPDWPSLLCISDSLNKWNIPNASGKVETSDIDLIPTPFIAYTQYNQSPLVIVKGITDLGIEVYQNNYNKPVIIPKETFIKKWTGVYLIAEADEHSGETNYKINKRKSIFKRLIPAGAFVTLIAVSLLHLNKIVGANRISPDFSTMGIYLQFFILLVGVGITSLLLWYEIDKNNPLLKKICNGVVKGNCNAILTGKHTKLLEWLSWSEVGFFYFSGSLLALLFSESFLTDTIAVLAWLNIMALPYTAFSLYYQWKVAKQWCVLCLGVQALLILGGLNVLANGLLLPLPKITPEYLLNIQLSYFLPVSIWYAAKPYILRLQEAKNTKREYQRIKFNAELFATLLKKQKSITFSAEELGISLGNPAATNTIIKVCNPYCGPCALAHPKIEELLDQNPNVRAKIIFTTTNDEANIAIKPVRHLLAIAESNNQTKIKQSLDDWYLSNKKDYDQFAAKYPLNGELLKQKEKIEAMSKWCEDMEITATPTIFINGYQIPDAYSIEDLKYFLLD